MLDTPRIGSSQRPMTNAQRPSRTTLRDLRQWAKAGEPFPMLTCYDATTARLLYEAGVRVLLVGDSAGQVILGHDNTLGATMPFMLEITAAVRRGAPDAFIMADLPFGSYNDERDAVRNAVKFMQRGGSGGGADAVKIEVEPAHADTVAAMARASIPVVAHLGWRPQRVARTGTAVVAGRTDASLRELVDAATLMEARGATMLLLEACTAQASAAVVDAVKLPVIGCGAGPAPHGHVILVHDLLGLTPWQPAFAPPTADGTSFIRDAVERWADAVRSRAYPSDDAVYGMSDGLRPSTG